MKLCINCRYFSPQLSLAGGNDGGRCGHPHNFSLVTGLVHTVDCEIMRAPNNRCGPEGRLFEIPERKYPEGP